jgi:N-carbamoyl-L-amino-acid hydrolase
MVQVFPNSRNVIPGRVKFSIDLRNVNDELLNTMHEEMTAFVDRTSRESGLAITLERVSYYPPCPFHPDCVGAVRNAAANRPWTWCRAPATMRSTWRAWRRPG